MSTADPESPESLCVKACLLCRSEFGCQRAAGYVPTPERLASGLERQREQARANRQARVIRPAEIPGNAADLSQSGSPDHGQAVPLASLPASHVPLYDPSVSLSVIARQIMRQNRERSATAA